MAATRRAKATPAGESGAEYTSTEGEDDGHATDAPPQQDQHGHTTEDEPATAQDTDVYEEAEAPDAQKQLAPEKDTQAEEEEEQDADEEEEEELAKAVQTEVAEDRLASEEPETEIETGEEALEVLRDLLSCTQADGQRMAERVAEMEKRKVEKEKEEAGKTTFPFSFFATGPRSWESRGDGYPTTKRRQYIQIVRTYTSRLPCP